MKINDTISEYLFDTEDSQIIKSSEFYEKICNNQQTKLNLILPTKQQVSANSKLIRLVNTNILLKLNLMLMSQLLN